MDEKAQGRRRIRLGSLMTLVPYALRYRVHVAIASLAILAAIMLIRQGERRTERPVVSAAPVKAKSSAQVA